MEKIVLKKSTVYTFFKSIVVRFKDLVGGHSYYLDKQKGLWTRREAEGSNIKRIFYWLCSGGKIGLLDPYKYLSCHGQYEGKICMKTNSENMHQDLTGCFI